MNIIMDDSYKHVEHLIECKIKEIDYMLECTPGVYETGLKKVYENRRDFFSNVLDEIRKLVGTINDIENNYIYSPCAIGDTVYIPRKQYYIGLTKYDESKVLRAYVTDIKVGIDAGKKYAGFYSRNGSETRWFNFSDIGKTVFLNKSLAAQALSQL